MVNFLLFFLHQICRLVNGSLKKLYLKSSDGSNFYTIANIYQNLLHIWCKSSFAKDVNLVKKSVTVTEIINFS